MSGLKKIMLAALCSVGIAFVLMWIVQSEINLNKQDLDAFAYPLGKQLSEENIVDYFANIPLQLPIVNVSLKNSVLSVDLLSIPGNTDEVMVYHDLFELSQFGLQRITNINQVRVRIMESKDSGSRNKELLLAMDSRKENSSGFKQTSQALDPKSIQNFLQSHYGITYTQKWKEQFMD